MIKLSAPKILILSYISVVVYLFGIGFALWYWPVTTGVIHAVCLGGVVCVMGRLK